MKSDNDILELIRRCFDGDATSDERQELQERLRSDPAARRLYARYANIDATLASGGIALKQPVPVATPARRVWSSWHPLTAAAAGIVFGMFCTSVVFAYAVPWLKQEQRQLVSVLQDGFEGPLPEVRRGFPEDSGFWSGDVDQVVPAESGISPLEGTQMLRLAPRTDRKYCALARIFDLAEFPQFSPSTSTVIEVAASFHGTGTAGLDQNQIRVAAFAEAPRDVRKIWNADPRLEGALLHTVRTVTMTEADHGWQTLKVEMEVPAGIRSVVIYLAAGMAAEKATKTPHFVDGVQVNVISQDSFPIPSQP